MLLSLPHRNNQILHQFLAVIGVVAILAAVPWLQVEIDSRQDRTIGQIEGLATLPAGKYLKPAMLGYRHVGADILWLSLLQVVGKKRNSADEYEWIYHALDVITTLDPQYAYAYYVGGNTLGDFAKRPDLSNRLLEKGAEENPEVWYIPFLLGYNHYFLLDDPAKGAEYMMRAASLKDRPAYLPGLATRLASEAGSPATALIFLQARLRDTQDPRLQYEFLNRMKEVIIERDIQLLERAVETFRITYRALPSTLTALVAEKVLSSLPQEPFGGQYILDPRTGVVSSSTHPNRLRTFFKRKQARMYVFPRTEPAYVFPRNWE